MYIGIECLLKILSPIEVIPSMQVEMNGKNTSDEIDNRIKQSIHKEIVKNEERMKVNDITEGKSKDEKPKKQSHLQQNKWKYISVFVLFVAVISASLYT